MMMMLILWKVQNAQTTMFYLSFQNAIMKLEVKESPTGSEYDISSNGGAASEEKKMVKSDKFTLENNQNEKEDEKEKEKKEESVGLMELFKFADKLDVFLLVFGCINAILCGAIFSVMVITEEENV